MAQKKLVLSDVAKKDLKVLMFLFIFGGVTILSERYLQAGELSVLFGAGANYIAFRVEQELKKEGYVRVLTKNK